MKILILEGCDNTGKTTLISNLIKKYNTKYNIVIRHCGKPIPNMSQQIFFTKELYTLTDLKHIEMSDVKETLVIYDRFVIGEYVWGSIYRNSSISEIRNSIVFPIFEKLNELVGDNNIFQLLLVASNEFIYEHDDGLSFSSKLNMNEAIDKINTQQNLFINCINNSEYNNLTNFSIYNIENDIKFHTFKSEHQICDDVFKILEKNNF